MSCRIACLAIVLVLSVVPMARADTVRFKSGAEIEGEVTRLRGWIRVENECGTTTVPASRVEQITREPPLEQPQEGAASQVERATEEPLSKEAREEAAPPADGDVVLVTDGGPRVGTISTGMRVDVRPIVGPRRRYVYLELRARRAYAPTWRSYRFETPRAYRR